jgi:hypothetical protein
MVQVVEHLPDKYEKYLDGFGFSDDFLGITAKALLIEEISDKLEFIIGKNSGARHRGSPL